MLIRKQVTVTEHTQTQTIIIFSRRFEQATSEIIIFKFHSKPSVLTCLFCSADDDPKLDIYPQLVFVFFLGLVSFDTAIKFHLCARGWQTRSHVLVSSRSPLARLRSPPSFLSSRKLWESFKLKWQHTDE